MLTGNGRHGSNDCNDMDAPVAHILGVVGPLGVEVETHDGSSTLVLSEMRKKVV